MPSPLLIITAVDQEARAIAREDGVVILVGGVGRTNAACATTEAIIRHGPFDAVISAGVAGALPGGDLGVGDVLAASACVYHEEGIVTPGGFASMASIGFSLGDFTGNAVPVDERLLEALGEALPIGAIATVATCSGTNDAAALVAQRTGARAEAMEGAAVVHAARRLRTRAIELRAISNFAGNRAGQQWDLPRALEALGEAMRRAVELIRSCGSR